MDDFREVYEHFEVVIVNDVHAEELAGLQTAYAVVNMDTGVREFETPHIMNCYRFIYDSLTQGEVFKTELLKLLASRADREHVPEGFLMPDNDVILPDPSAS